MSRLSLGEKFASMRESVNEDILSREFPVNFDAFDDRGDEHLVGQRGGKSPDRVRVDRPAPEEAILDSIQVLQRLQMRMRSSELDLCLVVAKWTA